MCVPVELQDGVNGFCVPSGDKEGYVAAVRSLVKDTQLRAKVVTYCLRYPPPLF